MWSYSIIKQHRELLIQRKKEGNKRKFLFSFLIKSFFICGIFFSFFCDFQKARFVHCTHKRKCMYTDTSELHLQQVVIVSVEDGKGDQQENKVSRLSITELSECYLCQTPTILSSDTETASRTSGRRGKHSRTPREVWQRHWMQQA